MAGRNRGVPQPTEIYSWDLLYDYGMGREEMWRHYLKHGEEAGASRESPGKA